MEVKIESAPETARNILCGFKKMLNLAEPDIEFFDEKVNNLTYFCIIRYCLWK